MNLPGYDLVTEKTKDKELLKLKEEFKGCKASHAINSKYILLDNVHCYLSKADSEPVIQLYIPEHVRKQLIQQYHYNNGHMGIDKTHNAIRTKYCWLDKYKNLYQYITSCATCQTRNLR